MKAATTLGGLALPVSAIRDDRVYLAHIRAEHARNYRAYGRQRMTDELRDQGIVDW